MVTGKIAKYRDPLTGHPYASLEVSCLDTRSVCCVSLPQLGFARATDSAWLFLSAWLLAQCNGWWLMLALLLFLALNACIVDGLIGFLEWPPRLSTSSAKGTSALCSDASDGEQRCAPPDRRTAIMSQHAHRALT